jgi:hypothetical protein
MKQRRRIYYSAAIIAAAILDDLLNQLLTARLLKLGSDRHDSLFERTNAPLSSFSAKIEMCFAVGVISNSARFAMHLIRDVRNEFAHRIEQITFDHPTVANMIQTRILSGLGKPGRSNRDLFIVIHNLRHTRRRGSQDQATGRDPISSIFLKSFGPFRSAEGSNSRSASEGSEPFPHSKIAFNSSWSISGAPASDT